jgi:hypothetical protein
MNSLYNNLENLLLLKKKITNNDDKEYYNHHVIKNNNITNNTITVVMTSCNRSKQVYFTLDTLSKSDFKDIQIILADDSSHDKVCIDKLEKYPFYFDFLEIKRENKIWVNPCINYNIAFNYIKGTKVILQNSEVCHVGDVLLYINNNLKDNDYFVFNVKSSNSYENNEIIYNNYTYNNNIFSLVNGDWYQHQLYSNRYLHFLTALTKKSFDKINGFSYDYFMGIEYDDDDLLLKIKLNNLNIINITNDNTNCGGIHLYHGPTNSAYIQTETNNQLFFKKNRAAYTIGYIEISDGKNIDEVRQLYNTLNHF